ncbi:MAG TPA: heme utilization cystosolic carrier protein HutX [Rhabdaerophilum sp.]|nr:heme utilization cystosolic carrier protein HutX [Rhabdaerophilum sp.]
MQKTEAAASFSAKQALLRDRLAEKPDGVVETLAREIGVPTQVVLEALPSEARIFVGAERFEEIWNEVGRWGEVLFIVHTSDIVLECTGSLPKGTHGQGYFNIHGDSPIGGHIRLSNCAAIYLVDRLFHGRRSCSIQFFNREGEAMFKIFVRRNKERNLDPAQLQFFEALKRSQA